MGILEIFKELKDPRSRLGRRHSLISILFIAVMSGFCYGEDFTDMVVFGKEKLEWLKEYIDLPHGIPSHDTFARVFSLIDPDQFQKVFFQWVESLREKKGYDHLAIDGKTLRGSRDDAIKQRGIHLVNVWCHKEKLCIAQYKVPEKANENTALIELIEVMDIKGSVITVDAMGTQREIAQKIVNRGGDYVMALKKNHPDKYADVSLFFQGIESGKTARDYEWDVEETTEKGHGRIEKREALVSPAVGWMDNPWPGLQAIGKVTRTWESKGTTRSDTRYFLLSHSWSAKEFGQIARDHWGVENNLHWVLDVVFDEDHCRARKNYSPQNMAMVRKINLNLLGQDKTTKHTMPKKRRIAALSDQYRERLIQGIFDHPYE